ncbi:MAG: hypothetical protein JNJ73_10755 [Hyphomonadaceae bacterium]|nr:hypothetical protein [Hyphomonadaceae bacterium]
MRPQAPQLAQLAQLRARQPLWPFVLVAVLYGLTFAIGALVSNDAEQRFADRGAVSWTRPAP